MLSIFYGAFLGGCSIWSIFVDAGIVILVCVGAGKEPKYVVKKTGEDKWTIRKF